LAQFPGSLHQPTKIIPPSIIPLISLFHPLPLGEGRGEGREQRSNRVVDAQILVILGRQLDQPAGDFLKQGEVLHQV
jgi:hypothetical protein